MSVNAYFSQIMLISCLAALGCSKPKILLVVPQGFRGVLEIRLNEESGKAPARKDGLIQYKFPPTGLLLVSDISPFFVWHKLYAEYEDGTPLSIEHPRRPASEVGKYSPDDVLLRNSKGTIKKPGAETGPDTLLFLVGTEKDNKWFLNEHIREATILNRSEE